jgi:hypothetical protein
MAPFRTIAAVVSLGLAAAGPAVGQPAGPRGRRVVVVDAAGGPSGAATAAALRAALAADPDLEPIVPGDLARALEEPLPDLGSLDPRLAAATAELAAATAALDRFQSRKALAALARAEAALLAAPPVDDAVALFAGARFVAGLAHLREQNRGLAEAAFALAVRLVPARGKPDPTRYPPEVIEAIGRAARPGRATIGLTVTATFDGVPVFVDGSEVGATPWQGAVAPGLHLVQVWSPAHQPDGRVVELVDEPSAVRLDLEPLPIAERARTLRRTLFGVTDPVELRAALAATAELAGVDAALVVLAGDDGPRVASYERAAHRLSVARPLAAASGLFGLLSPAELPSSLDLVVPPGAEPPAPWYLRPLGVASLAAAGIATLTTIVVIAAGDGEVLPRRPQPQPLGP